ncbi:MAG: hypothetical protein U9Q79_11455, partial [Candidatus Hydrogenedentes bacterium]|nr:hypothetical protein [Candidatus Hydrogenedentota bacterium]
MKSKLHILIVVTFWMACLTAEGDTLSLARGDILKGELVDLSGGIVVFDTGLAGQVIVPVSQVRSLSTENSYDIELQEGSHVRGHFVGQGSATRLVSESGGKGILLQLASIKNITPVLQTGFEESSATYEAPSSLAFSWEGGYLYRWGNREYDAAFTRLTLRNRAEAFDFRSETMLEVSDEYDFPHLFRSYADWRFPSGASFQPELGLEIERDLDEGLEFRGSLNAGIAKTFVENTSRFFDLAAGINAAFEYYDAEEFWSETESPLRRRIQAFYYADERHREEDQDINLRFRLRFRQFAKIGTLSQTISLYPNMTDF